MALNIKNWALEDRPREKMMAHGAETLSKAELLAILIGSGIPGKSAVELMREVLADYGDSLKRLGRASVQELMKYKGMGEAKAITVLAACQLANRRLDEQVDRDKVGDAKDIYEYFRARMADLTVEEFHVLYLNQSLKILGSVMLSRGGLASTSVDLREVMRHALLFQATTIALCHNHPSGSLRPSRDDDSLTHKVSEACKVMNLRLLDHVIVTDGGFYSYMDQGRL